MRGKKRWKNIITALVCSLLWSSAGTVSAGNRALLIGVGDYQSPAISDLPGIDLDINMIKDTARLMDFSEDQIKVLRDNQATSKNIENAIRSWLGGAGADDRVLFYFSGHGSGVPDESGDEADGTDEVLAGYDTQVIRKNGKASLENVVLDDTINTLLNGLQSNNILVMFDSCHSGTASKDLQLNFKTGDMQIDRMENKFFYYPGMPKTLIRKAKKQKKVTNYVSMAACRDDEQSEATSQGSLYTLGISLAVKAAAGSGKSITPVELQQSASDYIAKQASSSSRFKAFHPQINGNSRLMNKDILLTSVSAGDGPGWQELDRLYRQVKDKSLALDIQPSYAIGDPFVVSAAVRQSGYLLLLYVDAMDEITILYPNAINPDGQVDSGRVKIPGPNMDFDLTITKPSGKHQVVAFWSRDPFKSYANGRKAATDIFAVMSAKSMDDLDRGIGISRRTNSTGGQFIAGQAEFFAH